MLTLYGKVQSRAARCLWVLEETGLAYRHVATDPAAGETREPAYLALNPTAKVPTLSDGEFVLTESIAIASYLAALAPTPLWPDDHRTRATIQQWSSWAISEMEPPVTRLVRARRDATASGTAIDPAGVASCIADIKGALATVERRVAGHDYLVAGTFTLADINAATAVMVAPLFIDMADFPRTAAWLARVLARPAWLRATALT